jgi:protein TonB
VAKRPVKAPIALKREPEEQLTEDPVLAEIDKVEPRETFSQAPVLSSFGTYQARPAEPRKRRGPVLLLLLLLAGGGFYAAWMYQPGFREMVQPQIDRVMALVGQRPQPKAPVVTQNAPVAAPAPAPQEASTGNQTPASDASAALEAAAAVPGASAASNTKPVAETTPAKGTETTGSTDSGEATRSIPLENPPEMDKNVIILSSKGAEKRLISKIAPVYPKQAKATGVEGTLVLKVLISDTGKVTNVSLIEGNPILATAAMRAVRQWRYRPYVRAGKSLAFQTIVLLDFQR